MALAFMSGGGYAIRGDASRPHPGVFRPEGAAFEQPGVSTPGLGPHLIPKPRRGGLSAEDRPPFQGLDDSGPAYPGVETPGCSKAAPPGRKYTASLVQPPERQSHEISPSLVPHSPLRPGPPGRRSRGLGDRRASTVTGVGAGSGGSSARGRAGDRVSRHGVAQGVRARAAGHGDARLSPDRLEGRRSRDGRPVPRRGHGHAGARRDGEAGRAAGQRARAWRPGKSGRTRRRRRRTR